MIEVYHCRAEDVPTDEIRTCALLACDPPYSEYVHANAVSAGWQGRGTRKRDFGFESLDDQLRDTIASAAANVTRWALVYSDVESCHLWRAAAVEAGAEYIRTLPWVRWSQPQKSGDRPPTGLELLSLFRPAGFEGKSRWNGPGSLIEFDEEVPCLREKSLRGADKHPTEKPIDQALRIVSWFSDPGERVVDLVCGSGPVPLACRLLGRDCLAVDADEHWAAWAKYRAEAPLDKRDLERARRFVAESLAEIATIPEPKAPDGSDVKTWERAQRRLQDVQKVQEVTS